MRLNSVDQRLAFVLPDLRGGGAERITIVLGQYFRDLGHPVDYVLVQARGELLDLVPDGSRVIDLKATRLRDAIGPLARYLREVQPVGMQVSLWPLTAYSVIARLRSGATSRLVLSDHNTLSKSYAGRGRLHRLYLAGTIRASYPFANACIAVSGGVASDLAAISGLPVDRWKVVYNPIAAPPATRPAPPSLSGIWGSREGKRLLAVGSFKAQKNFPLLVRAFARVSRTRSATLAIVGEGPLRSEIERTIVEEGVCDSVILPGFTKEPWPFYESADLYVMSSDNEGFPMVLVEALHYGLPVVSTDCPSGPREILEEPFGRLVPCGDVEALAAAVEFMLDNPPDPSFARAKAKEYAVDRIAETYLRLMLGVADEEAA